VPRGRSAQSMFHTAEWRARNALETRSSKRPLPGEPAARGGRCSASQRGRVNRDRVRHSFQSSRLRRSIQCSRVRGSDSGDGNSGAIPWRAVNRARAITRTARARAKLSSSLEGLASGLQCSLSIAQRSADIVCIERRRDAASPASPTPRSASEAGSGTAAVEALPETVPERVTTMGPDAS
jgi:hypothetical protein